MHFSKVLSIKCSSSINRVQRVRGSNITLSRRQVLVSRDNSTTMCSRRRNSKPRLRRVLSHIGLTIWRKLLLSWKPRIRQKQLILSYLPSMHHRLLIPRRQMFRGKLAKLSRFVYICFVQHWWIWNALFTFDYVVLFEFGLNFLPCIFHSVILEVYSWHARLKAEVNKLILLYLI